MAIKKLLITGANIGLGKECARQVSQIEGVEKIYLACRNEDRAKEAKADLEATTGKKIFEIIIMDTSDLSSVRKAVDSLEQPIDSLVMNAGGALSPNLTSDGVTQSFAVNVLGHVVLTEALLEAGKLINGGVVVYSGTEAVRGISEFGFKAVQLEDSSVQEFESIADGSFFGKSTDNMEYYGPTKYVASLWMSSMARRYPNVRFVTMSPGATMGTAATNNVSMFQRFFFKTMMKIFSYFGKAHGLEDGAKRYVDALVDDSYKSGIFYASIKATSGPVGDQGELYFSDLKDTKIQDNANQAIHHFIRV